MRSASLLRLVAAISLVYDGAVGILMLGARGWLAHVFAVPLPQPPIHAELNGVLLLAVAAGYLMPFRDPERHRGYLWIMGVLLKGGGALTLVVDHFVHHAPTVFLLFAVTDGALAVFTLWALVTAPAPSSRSAACV
ncbi:MAG TPA: hypothetical protein VIC33_12620 [Vicinamibacterales bacterium]|jgi:hypothetical protein